MIVKPALLLIFVITISAAEKGKRRTIFYDVGVHYPYGKPKTTPSAMQNDAFQSDSMRSVRRSDSCTGRRLQACCPFGSVKIQHEPPKLNEERRETDWGKVCETTAKRVADTTLDTRKRIGAQWMFVQYCCEVPE